MPCHSLRTMAFVLPSGTALRTSEQAIPQQNASNANQPALRFRQGGEEMWRGDVERRCERGDVKERG